MTSYDSKYSLKDIYVILVISLLNFISLIALPNDKLLLKIDSQSDYLCYYGHWDNDKIFRGRDFDLIILEPSHITVENIYKLRTGHDDIIGTDDDVIVIGYISVGEDHSSSNVGDGRGPCYYDYNSKQVVYQNKGLASWYVDDKDKNGLPDADPVWKSAYVNASDTLWWDFLKNNPNGADVILKIKNCDGLFLDLLDTASPWYPWPYRWTVAGMSDLVEWLRNTYPDKYLIGNRGLFYFDPSIPEAYAHNIRPFVDGIMFESYFIESDRKIWAQKLNKEANKPDGFKVIALDYTDLVDQNKIPQQITEIFSYNWTDLISVVSLDEIPYTVFHSHTVDKNPPTWNNQIGLNTAIAGDNSVTLYWGALTDQSLPLKYDLCYTKDVEFNLESSEKLIDIHPDFDSSTSMYSYTVNDLINNSEYHFLLRVSDALGNSEHNNKVVSATPPYSGNQGGFIIDGSFNDWLFVDKLNKFPNPEITTGSSQNPDADYINLWAANDTSNLFISYQVAGTVASSFYYHTFIDADCSRQTGYIMNDSASIGADFMVESNYLYKYNGTGGTNWSWLSISNFEKKNNGSRAELRIPLSVLFEKALNDSIRVFFNVNNGAPSYNQLEVEPKNYTTDFFNYKIRVATGIDKSDNSIEKFELFQNYPNPFNSSTVIKFYLPEQSFVNLDLYNFLGEKVSDILNRDLNAGYHSSTFSSTNLPSGIYFFRLVYKTQAIVKKMVLLK